MRTHQIDAAISDVAEIGTSTLGTILHIDGRRILIPRDNQALTVSALLRRHGRRLLRAASRLDAQRRSNNGRR